MTDWAPPAAAPAAPVVPVADPNAIVEVTNVTKSFGDVVAVSDVTFTVGPGVTALLGPNGAGKSTLFRVMCGLTAPTRGTVRVLGADARNDRAVRGRIGLAPQQDALFDRLTGHRFVEVAAETHGVPDAHAAAHRVLDLVELDADDPKPVGAYSKGMRQRIKLAAALVHDPDLLILDEPLTGLDPVQRNRMIRLFHQLGDDGKCLLVSSHVLDEVAPTRFAGARDRPGAARCDGRLSRPARPDGRSPAPDPGGGRSRSRSLRRRWSSATW